MGPDGKYNSAISSKYPAELNQILVDAITSRGAEAEADTGEDEAATADSPVMSTGGLQHDSTVLGWVIEGGEPRALVNPDLLFGP